MTNVEKHARTSQPSRSEPLRVLNLGAGVQSTAVLLMSISGVLPRIDHAIFADTGWEPEAVYRHLDWLETKAAEAGIPIHRVTSGHIRDDALHSQVHGKAVDGVRFASMPLFTNDPETGSHGMIRRQCTREFKIAPIEKFIRRELLGLAYREHAPENAVCQVFGISFDEWQRQRTPIEKWKSYDYPLVEKRITRAACLLWLEQQGYPTPPRSACIGCPYHSDSEWREMKMTRPAEWKDAVEFDRAIRNCEGMRAETFLHRSCTPLSEIDFRTDVDRGQLLLWQDECDGMCGT